MAKVNLHVSRAALPTPGRGQSPPDHFHQEVQGAHDPAPGGPPPHVLGGLATVGQGHCEAHQLALDPLHGDQQALDIQTDPHDIPLDLSSNPTYGYKSTSSSPDIIWEHFKDIIVHTVPTSRPDISSIGKHFLKQLSAEVNGGAYIY